MNDTPACPVCLASGSGDLEANLRRLSRCMQCEIDDCPTPACEATRSAILSELTQLYGPQAVSDTWAKVLKGVS